MSSLLSTNPYHPEFGVAMNAAINMMLIATFAIPLPTPRPHAITMAHCTSQSYQSCPSESENHTLLCEQPPGTPLALSQRFYLCWGRT